MKLFKNKMFPPKDQLLSIFQVDFNLFVCILKCEFQFTLYFNTFNKKKIIISFMKIDYFWSSDGIYMGDASFTTKKTTSTSKLDGNEMEIEIENTHANTNLNLLYVVDSFIYIHSFIWSFVSSAYHWHLS